LSLAREVGAKDITYVTLYPLATIALMGGDQERARRLFEEGLSLSFEVGEKVNVAFCLEGLAAVGASEIGWSLQRGYGGPPRRSWRVSRL
jgi:hypothetical protein